MDVLSGLLSGPRASGAFLLRSSFDPPWSLRVEDRAPLTVVAVVRGGAWVRPATGPPTALAEGDVAVLRGPDPYTVADAPSTAPTVRIGPGQVCTTLAGTDVGTSWWLGTRSWGTHADGSTVLLTGTYESVGEISRRLLEALPPLLGVRSGEWDSPLVALLAEEVRRDRPGQEAVLDRLLDLLTISVLRTWLGRAPDAPRWYRALDDPVAGAALRAVHDDPARPWTVADLAVRAGVSRASLARRFHDAVGEPPMTYLAAWRLALAADLLADPTLTVAAVARQVGYASPFTFSTAFKRAHGHSPRAHRATLAGTGPVASTG